MDVTQDDWKYQWYIGIDPGLSGAVAFLTVDESEIVDADVVDIPIYLALSNKKKVELKALTHLLRHIPFKAHVCLEEPHSMPNQGVSSSFKFGRILGQIEGILAGLQLSTTLVSPSTWKRQLGLTADKNATREIANQLWPNFRHMWPLKKHHDRAEAMLLAYWLWKYKK